MPVQTAFAWRDSKQGRRERQGLSPKGQYCRPRCFRGAGLRQRGKMRPRQILSLAEPAWQTNNSVCNGAQTYCNRPACISIYKTPTEILKAVDTACRVRASTISNNCLMQKLASSCQSLAIEVIYDQFLGQSISHGRYEVLSK